MRWKGKRQSTNVEDRRMSPGPKAAVGGGLGIIGMLVLGAIIYFMGGNPLSVLQNMPKQTQSGGGGVQQAELSQKDKELGQMVAVVLADTEDVWNELFAKEGMAYKEPTLVLFRGSVKSACGIAGSATGPFYCPADQQVYIDLSFFDDLANKLGAPGDFAQAYVIAHEVGHHVQNLMGLTDQVHQQRGRISQTEYNKLSVRLELQADYLAGVWAHHAYQQGDLIEDGDIDEALNAASAIGDDRLQHQHHGHVVPDSFTHGTSAQRRRWFLRGLKYGDLEHGDTFSAREL